MPPEFSKRRARGSFHQPPPWIPNPATFFITINCQNRHEQKLTLGNVSSGILDSFIHYQNAGKWFISLVLLMPDHLHALLCFNLEFSMSHLIKSWKRYTAKTFEIDWQRDYFDHRIRSEKDMIDKWIYIRENPVKAELVDHYEKWSHVLRGDGTMGW